MAAKASIVFFLLLWLASCSTAHHDRLSQGGDAIWVTESIPGRDLDRLARLWQQRRLEGANTDYALGPGDLLQVSVPGLEDLKDFSVRVSEERMIALPYAGTLNVTGLGERGLREEIRQRLQKDFMHHPQVTVLVKESRSRQIAVVGAVNKPGLFDLASRGETIFNMISYAGGLRNDAAERILFIPAESLEREQSKDIFTSLPSHLVRQEALAPALKAVEPIVINVDRLARGGDELYLSLPARPGDVVMVPIGGEVLIQGWVQKPGGYRITAGMTVLGAIAAAGGVMFPADLAAVRLIRTEKVGSKMSKVIDLEAIQRGEEPDLRVEPGDIVDVGASAARLIGYGVYQFFVNKFNVGASVPIFK
ncbi:MAG: hypothetical protein FJ145_20420 [Deltaproteobacteria bacterium]|nr:hypothetical protein [Deltaproteobacteria bacterium]